MFIKYSKIINYYQTKDIRKYFEHNPEVLNSTWYYQTKIDGANFQVMFEPHLDAPDFAKRNSVLSETENFYDWQNVVKKYKNIFDDIQELATAKNHSITLIGELYGNGIQKRIDYGKEKYIIIFDIRVNDKVVPYDILSGIFDNDHPMFSDDEKLTAHSVYNRLNNHLLFSKTIKIDYDVNSVFDFINAIDKLEIPTGHEGIVIKPGLIDKNRLYIKKKSDEFLEISKTRKKNKNIINFSIKVEELKDKYRKYFNENRVLSFFSKEGPITSKKDMGKYMNGIIQDAIDDFIKDHPEYDMLTKNEQRYIMAIGKETGIIANYLIESIEEVE